MIVMGHRVLYKRHGVSAFKIKKRKVLREKQMHSDLNLGFKRKEIKICDLNVNWS